MQQDLNSNKATVWVIDPATNEVVPQPGGSDSIETTYTTHTLQRDQTDRVNDFTAPVPGTNDRPLAAHRLGCPHGAAACHQSRRTRTHREVGLGTGKASTTWTFEFEIKISPDQRSAPEDQKGVRRVAT
jgi:hypothetical protein